MIGALQHGHAGFPLSCTNNRILQVIHDTTCPQGRNLILLFLTLHIMHDVSSEFASSSSESVSKSYTVSGSPGSVDNSKILFGGGTFGSDMSDERVFIE
jgi:hypothetical protein